jgi:replicative DNA helicase
LFGAGLFVDLSSPTPVLREEALLPSEKILEKVPPQNLEAEQAVLGAILLQNSSLNKALEQITPDDFYKSAHRKIFSAMIQMNQTGDAIDLVTLRDYLLRTENIDAVGGAAYLGQLTDVVPTAANIHHYLRIVREKSLSRRLINAATEIVREGFKEELTVEQLLEAAEKRIFEITGEKVRQGFVDIRSILKDSFEIIEKLYEKKELVTGVPSGFMDLDVKTSGFQPSDLIIVAGRPSMGKTAFCLNIAQHISIREKLPVAIFSLEMSKEQLVLRMLCAEARVDAHRLRTGQLGKTDWPKLTAAAGDLSEAPVFIDDTPAISILEMRAKSRRLMLEHGLAMIIVDYLQLMRGQAGMERREQEISEISRSLKALAKELNVPVVALSQLNRSVESRTDKRPMLADLRESGSIEQDADVILFVYRDEVYKESEDNRGKAEIIVGKQRNGPTGMVSLHFEKKFTLFQNFSSREQESDNVESSAYHS